MYCAISSTSWEIRLSCCLPKECLAVSFRPDSDEPQELAPGIKQSGNAKIAFDDEEYFSKVSNNPVGVISYFYYWILYYKYKFYSQSILFISAVKKIKITQNFFHKTKAICITRLLI